jgi:hypothetical protein
MRGSGSEGDEMSELKKCPMMCGGEVHHQKRRGPNEPVVWCLNDKCAMGYVEVVFTGWQSLPRRSERAGEIAEEMWAWPAKMREHYRAHAEIRTAIDHIAPTIVRWAKQLDSLTEPEKQECDQCDLCDAGPCRTLDAIHDCLGEARETIARLRWERDEAVTRCAGLSNDVETQSTVTAEHYRRNRRATQKIIAQIGSVGPESIEAATERVLEALSRLSVAEDKAQARVKELEGEVERLTHGEETCGEEGDPVADALGRARAARECYNDTSSYQAQEDSVDAILDTLVALSDCVTRQSDLVARLGGRVAELEEGK